jgi:hypothetical protein
LGRRIFTQGLTKAKSDRRAKREKEPHRQGQAGVSTRFRAHLAGVSMIASRSRGECGDSSSQVSSGQDQLKKRNLSERAPTAPRDGG